MKTVILILMIFLLAVEVLPQSNLIVKTKDGNWIDVPVENFLHMDFAPCGVIDYGGQTYYTIEIGDQCWFAQNLNIGTRIDGSINQQSGNGIEKYCYNNEPDSCTIYGGLYQWDEAMQYITTEGAQGICPTGWHIPTFEEFQILDTYVNYDGNTLKEIGQGSDGGAGTNTSGFSALLAGRRYYNFIDFGYFAFFWSSTEENAVYAYYQFLFISNFDYNFDYKERGLSIRCIKD